MLENLAGYYIYAELVKTGKIYVRADQIDRTNWLNHYNGVLNILRDGIETDYVQHLFVTLDFGTGDPVDVIDLSLNDYYFNLIMWYHIIALDDEKIQPKHLIFSDGITKKTIKKFIDDFFITPRKTKYSNRILNNVISDAIYRFVDIDIFALYLGNTLNLEDTIELMNASPEYDQIIHVDLSNEPLDNMKNKGMEYVNKAKACIANAEAIMGHEHCLRNPFAAADGINDKQYKDNSINIGTKPDGQGSIYHERINSSYITGGLKNLLYYYIDSASARVAQIISKENVGDSGEFARIVGLNNENMFLYRDPEYDCGTNNYLNQFIPNKDILNILIGRYYRLDRMSPLREITKEDTWLIGKTILLRSPIFCNSHAHGHGVCYHCYGKLAYTNNDINIGRIASELITSQHTQKKLSAKHVLEPKVKTIIWDNIFKNIFDIDINAVIIRKDLNFSGLKGWTINFNFDNIELENDDDFYARKGYSSSKGIVDEPMYNEYLTEFDVTDNEGNTVTLSATVEDDDGNRKPVKLYLTTAFREAFTNSLDIEEDSDMVSINLLDFVGKPIFKVKMENNDLGKALEEFEALIDNKAITKSFNASELIYRLQNNTIKGGIDSMSIHLEVLISNQICSINDRLVKPNWLNIDEPYEILTLNEALSDNPSIIISSMYRRLSRSLNYPLTFRKYGSSVFDPFFIRKPVKFMNVDHEILDIPNQYRNAPGESPVMYDHDYKNKDRAPRDLKKFMKPFNNKKPTELDS